MNDNVFYECKVVRLETKDNVQFIVKSLENNSFRPFILDDRYSNLISGISSVFDRLRSESMLSTYPDFIFYKFRISTLLQCVSGCRKLRTTQVVEVS